MATKTRRASSPGEPAYHRMTETDRITIEVLRKEGFSQVQIAERIGKSKSSVSREVRRNRSKKGYRRGKAEKKARFRAHEKARRRRKFTEAMWEHAMEKLRLGWSFAMIVGRARRRGRRGTCRGAP